MITILGVAAIYKGNDYLKTFLDHRASAKQTDATPQDTIIQLAELNENVEKLTTDVEHAHRLLIRGLSDNDEVLLNTRTKISGGEARRLIRRERRRRSRTQLDGRYVVERVQSGPRRNGFLVRVLDVNTDRAFDLPFPEGTLSERQMEQLQRSEWRKTALDMRVEVERVGREIVKAKLRRLRA